MGYCLISVDFGREAGDDPRDKTSLLPSQKSWGLERAHRPQELFVFEPPQNRRTQVLGNVQPMYRYQRIVLNFHNQIIKDYEHIPDTLSSEFEGAFMEAITRKDVRIDVEDFRSRMLESITLKGTQRELYKFNIFSSRMRRFREASFNLVWTVKRSGSETIMDFMASFLPPDCKTSNSTRNFRDMYKHEMILKEMLGFGRSLFRAGNNGRAVTPASREASYKKLVAKYDKLYEIFTKEQQKLANGLLPLSSTRRLESPAYHRLHLHWRAIIDRQRGEVADEDDEDAETASDEGIAFAPGTIANVEERATSRTYGNATARKRSFTDVEGEAVHEGSTNSSKRRRYSPTKRFLDVTEDNGSGQFYDLMPGFSTEIVTGTAPVLDPTLKAHVQASRGQKKDLDSVGNNTFAGEEIGFHSHPRDFRPLKRLRPTDEEKSQFIHNVGEKIAVKALSLPDNGGGLQNLKPGRKPRARSPAYRTAPGHQQANTRSGYDAWSTNPGNPYHPAPSMNLPPYQGMHEQPSPNIPTPCFSRKKYSDPPEYEEQHAYNVRQQIRRRPPPTIYPPLRSELMQEEQAQVLRPGKHSGKILSVSAK